MAPLLTWVAALMALVPHRWQVTPSWTLLHSSSVPARSLRSPVMLARPWMSVGQCVPQKLGQLGPCESPWLPCSRAPVPGVPMPGVPALPGAQGCPSPGVPWRWWSWRCEARPCSSHCLGVSHCCQSQKPAGAPLGSPQWEGGWAPFVGHLSPLPPPFSHLPGILSLSHR